MNKSEMFAASALSKEYFAESFYYIPVVGRGASKFHMEAPQKDISNQIGKHKLTIGLKARQIGWTTVGVFNAFHDAVFNEEHPWLFVSRTEDAAQKMLTKTVYAYYKLPKWFRDMLPKVTKQTQNALEFSNGSRIESVPATGSTGRGDSVYGALMDECAFMEYAEDIWAAVEPLVYGNAMLFSTANGMGNFFHEIWLDAQRSDSVWNGIFYPWSAGRQWNIDKERDEEWYENTRLGYRGREWLFYQEYPSTPEEAFAKSGRVAYAHDIVSQCYEEIEPYRVYGWNIGQGGGSVLKPGQRADIEVYQWKKPEVVRDKQGRPLWEPNYVLGCDVAEGLEHGDWTYLTVFDAVKREQVLSSKSAIPVSYLDELLAWVGFEYYNALMVVEHNMHGMLPLDRLYRDHQYPRLYRQDYFAQMRTADRTARYGWRTDRATKPKMVNDFMYALAEKNVIIHDPDFILEAQTFVADGKGGYGATTNNHDDVIMGTLVAWQGVLDSPSYPIIWSDPLEQAPTHDVMDELFFPDKHDKAEDRLEQPLGRGPQEKTEKSVILMPANWRHWV